MKKAIIEINKLKIYLDTDPRNKISLALALGYRSTSTIDKWIERKYIPRIRLKSVLSIIEREL